VLWLSLVVLAKFRRGSAKAEATARLRPKTTMGNLVEVEEDLLQGRRRQPQDHHHRRHRHLQMAHLSLGRRRFSGLTTCTDACMVSP